MQQIVHLYLMAAQKESLARLAAAEASGLRCAVVLVLWHALLGGHQEVLGLHETHAGYMHSVEGLFTHTCSCTFCLAA